MKIAGCTMIMLFFTFLGIRIADYKKSQIKFIDDIIFLCDFLSLNLKSSIPDSNAIMIRLQNDKRLCKYDLNNLAAWSTLDDYSNERLDELKNIFGKYVLDTQLEYIDEIKSYFISKKEEYSDNYKQHYKLYFALSMAMGFLVTILLY